MVTIDASAFKHSSATAMTISGFTDSPTAMGLYLTMPSEPKLGLMKTVAPGLTTATAPPNAASASRAMSARLVPRTTATLAEWSVGDGAGSGGVQGDVHPPIRRDAPAARQTWRAQP